MAKIDTSKIEGYDAMSAEEKLAALEAYDFGDVVAKATLDRATSEAAEWRRKYNSTLSEAEQARIAAEEEHQATQARLAELERKEQISMRRDSFMASGYAPELALRAATSFVDGDMDAVLLSLTEHAQSVAKKAADAVLHDTPTPPAGGQITPTIDYQQKAAEAASVGDFARAAYYQRQQHENK